MGRVWIISIPYPIRLYPWRTCYYLEHLDWVGLDIHYQMGLAITNSGQSGGCFFFSLANPLIWFAQHCARIRIALEKFVIFQQVVLSCPKYFEQAQNDIGELKGVV